MGVVYEFGNKFMSLDLGIVSPDMHIYRNQYREANRSFGELISMSFGLHKTGDEKIQHEYFLQIKSAGKFGIDTMQDFMHQILGLQPVNKINDLVRMPNNTWYGVGGTINKNLGSDLNSVNKIGFNYYLGTDRSELTPFFSNTNDYKNLSVSSEIGIRSVFYDEIVSAPPVDANYRSLIPYLEFGVTSEYFGLIWFVRDRFSLPTLTSDNSIFGMLSAGIEFNLN